MCGLPAFKDASGLTSEMESTNEQASPSIDDSLSETAIQIRTALASVAQISEKDIERGMSIFHIGLDSISAIKVSSTLRKQGVILSVGEMLKAGTVDKMAEIVETRTQSDSNRANEPKAVVRRALGGLDQNTLQQVNIEASQVDQFLPITAGQLYMLSMWLNTKGRNFYPEFVYDLQGSMTFQNLQELWQKLIAANPVLRTHICRTDQKDFPYVQVILNETKVLLTDITGQDDGTAICTMNKVTTQQPWVHLFASRTASGWALKLKIHHVLYDGVSLPLLIQQFQSYCNGGTPSASDHTFEEYVAMGHVASAPAQREAFWTKYLKGVELRVNTKAEVAPMSKTEIFKPGLLQTSDLEAAARQHGISTQALFLAAYAKLHAARACVSNNEDVVIGIYLANRSLPIDNISTAAIPIVNLLPLRIHSPLTTTTFKVASQIQSDLRLLGDPVNATTSLYEINEWTGVKIDTFVNLLSLPSPNDNEIPHQENKVQITPKAGWQQAVSRVVEVDQNNCHAPEDMVNERVNAAYLVSIPTTPTDPSGRDANAEQHAVDIEATIRGGKLDVGVFAPTHILSLEEGEKVVEGLRSELERLG